MSFVVSASQWLFVAALLKRKPSGNAAEGKVEQFAWRVQNQVKSAD